MTTFTAIVENAINYGIQTPLQIAKTTNESCETVEHALCLLLQERKIIRVKPMLKMFIPMEKINTNLSANLKILKKNCQTTKRAQHNKLLKKLKTRQLPKTKL